MDLSAVLLQKNLIKIIENDTELLRLSKPGTSDLSKINVYAQRIPTNVHKDEDPESEYDYTETEFEESEDSDEESFPLALVKIVRGQVMQPMESYRVTVQIIFGIYDPTDDNGGELMVVNLLERMQRILVERGVVGDSWSLCRYNDNKFPMIEWQLSEDDTAPYFFGGLTAVYETTPPANLQTLEYT